MGITARLKKVRPGYRAGAVVAGAAVFAGAAFFVSGGASADTQKLPRAFDGRTSAKGLPAAKIVSSDVINKLPNAQKTTTTEYKLGKTGPAFAPNVSTRIVGGGPTSTSAHPYIVGLKTIYYEDLGGPKYQAWESTCTGTVISPTRVLTAGHCSFYSPLGTTYVIAGRSDLTDTSSGFVTTVRSTFTHQGYNDSTGAPVNDAAVLTLTNPLPAAYTPIAIGAQGDESVYADNTPAKIVGYGYTAKDAANSLNILREADVPIRSDATCVNGIGIPGYQNASMVCAGVPRSGTDPGKDTCGGDSGGPLIVVKNGVKTEVGITSWGPADCGVTYGAYTQISTYSNLIKAEAARNGANNLDWTGDGHSDLLVRDGNGNLTLWSTTGLFNDQYKDVFTPDPDFSGDGWNIFRKMFRVYDWNNDRHPSVFAVDAVGDLWQYRGDGLGEFDGSGRVKIGTGWNMFNDIMVTNNWTGNGKPNLLGRKPNGDLYLYTSNGAGAWENGGVGIKIGNGWNGFNTILTPGDWKGDGRQTLIGRTPSGDLRLYQSNGAGGWVNGLGEKIGNGWESFSIFMAPGDMNGDNLVDVIGVTPAGQMRLYETDGHGNWISGFGWEIGSGWNVYNAIF